MESKRAFFGGSIKPPLIQSAGFKQPGCIGGMVLQRFPKKRRDAFLSTKKMMDISFPPCTSQFFGTFLGWLNDGLERLSDLQLGDKKVASDCLVLLV